MGEYGNGSRSSRGRRKADRELEVQFELMRIIAEQNHEITFEYDVDLDRASMFEVVNGKFTEISTFEEYRDRIEEHSAYLNPEDFPLFAKTFKKCLKKPSRYVIDVRLNAGRKRNEWHRLFLASVDDLDGKVATVAGRFISIHAEKIANDNIKHQAEIDALTGVYNHNTFEKIVEKKLKECKSQLLFMMIDIDDFKIINDTLGHNVGDLILAQTGSVLKETLGDRGYAGRMGGDEFAIVAWDFEDEEEMKEFCTTVRTNLKAIIFDMEYSASMGVAFLSERKFTFKDIYYEADQAVYTAKNHGKNQIVYYDEIALYTSEVENSDIPAVKNRARNIYVSEDERDRVEIDKRPEYILIIDAEYKKIVQLNATAREAIICDEDFWIDAPCFELFGKCNSICQNCGNKGEQFFISKAVERIDDTLTKMFGPKDFWIRIFPFRWKGIKTNKVFLIDLGNPAQVTAAFGKREYTFAAIEKFTDYVVKSNGQYDYKQIIRMGQEFYDADCVALVKGNRGAFDQVDVVTKPNSKVVGDLIEESVNNGKIRRFDTLWDKDNDLFINRVEQIKDNYPELYLALVDARVWKFVGRRLGDATNPVGYILILNPRQNEDDSRYYQILSAFLADELFNYETTLAAEYARKYDKLTGLYSRKVFEELDGYAEDNSDLTLGIFAADIVGLKYINREFGYESGNVALRKIAEIYKSVFVGYHSYRFEDDQFMVFCHNIEEESFHKLVIWAKEMIDELSVPVAVGYSWTKNVNLPSQLAAIYDSLVRDKDEKLALVDTKANQNVADEVNDYLASGKFMVYLQPKVNMRTNKVVGAEALIRLKADGDGVIGPVQFIHVFEKYNLVHKVDLLVLEKVCEFIRGKIDAGEEIIPISINFSKKTLEYPKLIEIVKECMEKYAIPNGYIEIEITETVGDMDHVLIKNVANNLRTMGFVLAMDDFGTQYSNISTLVKFRFGIAKIDRSIIMDIEENEKSVVVLRHLTNMIKDMGIECVIEGVETQGQIDILKTMNCDIIQGYFYGKPTDASEFYEKFMKQ